jgi:hypothetical protein
MMNDEMNQVLRGNTLCSDGAEHDALRKVLVRPLTPKALQPHRDAINAQAEAVVDRLVEELPSTPFPSWRSIFPSRSCRTRSDRRKGVAGECWYGRRASSTVSDL